MKNVVILFSALFSIIVFSFQNQAFAGDNQLKFGNEAFKKGNKALNLGLGVGNVIAYGGGVAWPALSVSYEQGIIDDLGPGNLGVGAYFGFQFASYDYGSNYKRSWTDVFFGARGAYHYNFNLDPKFDCYAGVLVGGRVQSFSDNGNVKATGYGGFYPSAGVYVGARYQFAGVLGCYAEVGRGIAYLNFGLDLKF